MSDKAELLARLASLVAVDVRRPLTERLCDACRQMLGGDGASVTIAVPAGDRITLSATDADAAALEDLQEVLGEGPMLDAYSWVRASTWDTSRSSLWICSIPI